MTILWRLCMAIGNHLINSVGFEVQPNCGHFLFSF